MYLAPRAKDELLGTPRASERRCERLLKSQTEHCRIAASDEGGALERKTLLILCRSRALLKNGGEDVPPKPIHSEELRAARLTKEGVQAFNRGAAATHDAARETSDLHV